jgi:hypothetical protein
MSQFFKAQSLFNASFIGFGCVAQCSIIIIEETAKREKNRSMYPTISIEKFNASQRILYRAELNSLDLATNSKI